jgi:hypothetical protein
MENKTKQETERWVEERMELLAVPHDWEPDAGVARTRFHGRRSARRPTLARVWLPRAAAAALASLGIGADSQVAIRQVTLRAGPATLIERTGEVRESERITLIWSVTDRVYFLHGVKSEDQAILVANSIE